MNVLIGTNPQKVLNLFLNYPHSEFMEGEIRKITGISKSGINYALRDLVKSGYVDRKQKGKSYFYSLIRSHPVNKQLKVVNTIQSLLTLINKLRDICDVITLFGSAARGEDHEESDIDLFIISHNKEEAADRVRRFKLKRKIQAVIRTSLNYTEMKKTDPHFFNEINSGIKLWETSGEKGI